MELLLLLAVCGALVYAQGLVLGKGSLRGVKVSRRFSDEACYAGERLEIVETIENAKGLPVPWLRLETMLPASIVFRGRGDTSVSRGRIYQNHTSLFTLQPRVKIVRTHQTTCVSRGVFVMETASLTGGDLFSIHTPSITLSLPHKLTVYPAPMEESVMPDSWRSWQGELEVRRWIVEDPFVVSGTRAYMPGDAFNRIDWKASARSLELQVRRHGHTADPRAMILLNIEESEMMWDRVTRPDDMETTISCAAALAAGMLGRGLSAGFAHNGVVSRHSDDTGRVEFGSGSGKLEETLASMAAIEPRIRLSFHELLRREAGLELSAGVDYLLVTAFRSERIMEAAALLEQSGHRVAFVDPPVRTKGGRRS